MMISKVLEGREKWVPGAWVVSYGSKTTLCDTIVADYAFVQAHREHFTSAVVCGFWVILMNQCWFIDYNKNIMLV